MFPFIRISGGSSGCSEDLSARAREINSNRGKVIALQRNRGPAVDVSRKTRKNSNKSYLIIICSLLQSFSCNIILAWRFGRIIREIVDAT